MDTLLDILRHWPAWLLWIIFLAENTAIMIGVLIFGKVLQRRFGQAAITTVPKASMFAYSRRQWAIAWLTTLLNTVVTYAGYWLWIQGDIRLTTTFSGRILLDALILFFAMDLLMYVFHYLIHKTPLYKLLHTLHHEAVDPEPIDLFILHPLETLSFGALWLLLLLLCPFNIYGIIIYLIINVIFGMTGHLGMEPVPENMRQWPLLKYLGTSTFHHTHHRNEQCNFGFYTSIWDRVFRTFNDKA
ncbi:sterol desaturase family protein [Chitinophaga sp. 22321]|uniref:Sterol desaturase family protein n=1 Tax=Chitinophaga hostae TaxID=2831022 RepID=A0ABS5J0F0_9BACT|nr:sterol desaturase family protein [Chitinophaga hostae]MBS0028585.1 sterol desaturase family protein [Chitinophaga hostae]